MIVVFFFVKQKTAYEMRISDWRSDVCSSVLAGKRPGLATLKILGADSATVMRIYALQILAVAAAAIVAGLAVGAFAPSIITAIAGDVLPVKPGLAVYQIGRASCRERVCQYV